MEDQSPATAHPDPDAAVPGAPRSFPLALAGRGARGLRKRHYPYPRQMGVAAYEAEKARLQAELLKVQIWAQETGRSS